MKSYILLFIAMSALNIACSQQRAATVSASEALNSLAVTSEDQAAAESLSIEILTLTETSTQVLKVDLGEYSLNVASVLEGEQVFSINGVVVSLDEFQDQELLEAAIVKALLGESSFSASSLNFSSIISGFRLILENLFAGQVASNSSSSSTSTDSSSSSATSSSSSLGTLFNIALSLFSLFL